MITATNQRFQVLRKNAKPSKKVAWHFLGTIYEEFHTVRFIYGTTRRDRIKCLVGSLKVGKN
jgi:hypothetical protein